MNIRAWCKNCGKQLFLLPCRKTQKFCSPQCYWTYVRTTKCKQVRVPKICLACNKTYYVVPFLFNKRSFCSHSCSNRYNQKEGSWNKGIPQTAEVKRKISVGVRRIFSCNDYINPSTRPEVREKISKTITKLFSDPTKNPRYIDGRSQEPYPITFNRRLKEKIRKRDGYICKVCGVDQYKCYRKLDVHHLDSDKNNLSEENLVSLCPSCHQKSHTVSKQRSLLCLM